MRRCNIQQAEEAFVRLKLQKEDILAIRFDITCEYPRSLAMLDWLFNICNTDLIYASGGFYYLQLVKNRRCCYYSALRFSNTITAKENFSVTQHGIRGSSCSFELFL